MGTVNTNETKAKIEELDQKIRNGEIRFASKILNGPESELIPVLERAQFFRRIGLYSKGLLALRPAVFIKGELNPKADSKAIVEYAINLVQIGLYREAKHLLKKREMKTFQDYQTLGFIALRELDYENAVQYFYEAQNLANDTYQKQIAIINRLNAKLGLFQYDETIKESLVFLNDLENTGSKLLIQYLYNILSQAYAFMDDPLNFKICSTKVFQMGDLDQNDISSNTFEFFRARFVSEAALKIKHEVSFQKISEIAINLQEYNALTEFRIMNAFSLSAPKSRSELLKQVMCTEKTFFGKRVEFILGEILEIPETFVISERYFQNTKKGSSQKPIRFKLEEGMGRLKVGQLPHRLFTAFLKNCNHAFSVEEMFEKVFPEKNYYHPNQSPNLIHQAVKRLNTLLKENEIPIEVLSVHKRYSLRSLGPFQIKMKSRSEELPTIVNLWRIHFKGRSVQNREASIALQIGMRQLQVLIRNSSSYFSVSKSGREIYYRVNED